MSSTGFTNNAALVIAKWFTSPLGMNLAWSKLNEPALIASANICDERVLVKDESVSVIVDAGTNVLLPAGSRALDWGDGVRFTTSGSLPGGISAGVTYYVIPTDYGIRLASTVAGAFAENAIDITSAGSSSLLHYYDEARYKIAGEYKLDVPKGEVLKQLLTAMAGVAVYIGGKWFLHAGAAAVPTVTLTENDLRGDLTWVPKRQKRDRFNGVRSIYVNPDGNWQPTDAPPLLDAGYVAEDGGEELYADLRFPFTTSSRCAQRLQKIYLERNRQQGTLSFPAKLSGMKLQVWDGVYISIERYGWVQKQFRVIDWALTDEGGIDLMLQEDAASVYTWDVSEEVEALEQEDVIAPDPSAIAVPSLTVTTPQTLTFTRLFVEWTGDVSIWTAGFDLEHRAATVSAWTSYGRIATLEEKKAVVERTVPTDFRIRTANKNGAVSAWSEALAPGPPTSVVAALDGTPMGFITWDNAPTCVTIYLFKDGLMHNNAVSGPAEIVTGLNDGAYQLRSVDAKGNISALSASVTVTGAGVGGGGGDDDGGDGGDGDGGDGDDGGDA